MDGHGTGPGLGSGLVRARKGNGKGKGFWLRRAAPGGWCCGGRGVVGALTRVVCWLACKLNATEKRKWVGFADCFA